MGMHVGFITSDSDWPALHAALEARCGTLTDSGAISQHEWFDLPPGEDVFHAATHEGRTYVLDPGLVLSSNSDLIVEVAAELSCVVVGAGAETVSGSFWFSAADAGGLRRLHFNVASTLTEPFDVGDPMPSESSVRWDDIDGAGIFARLTDLGFAEDVLMSGSPEGGRRVAWTTVQVPPSGPLGAQVNEHCEQHRRPDADEWMKNITVQVRNGGYDLRAGQTGAGRGSKIRRLFKRGT
jgi:hypothetical protein